MESIQPQRSQNGVIALLRARVSLPRGSKRGLCRRITDYKYHVQSIMFNDFRHLNVRHCGHNTAIVTRDRNIDTRNEWTMGLNRGRIKRTRTLRSAFVLVDMQSRAIKKLLSQCIRRACLEPIL